ncbi:XRE family transcriptional regulator [Rhodoferax aquaticus]|uniref:XRE family transcriptional regulator n=1 Tax=Rhodoferax aquaticus TaxID=2527691 RepID=A0A515EKT5_9BURK|nr:XRE family transcriptional regulator [Rhodoferax aquaticus]
MTHINGLELPSPSGSELKAARLTAGLSQVQAAELMAYPVQAGSRGGLQSRTWQALESTSDDRNMPGPTFALFLLLTDQHPSLRLVPRDGAHETSACAKEGHP